VLKGLGPSSDRPLISDPGISDNFFGAGGYNVVIPAGGSPEVCV
jgi:hypothetical protein